MHSETRALPCANRLEVHTHLCSKIKKTLLCRNNSPNRS